MGKPKEQPLPPDAIGNDDAVEVLRAFEKEGVGTSDEALAAIVAMFEAELGRATDVGVTSERKGH